MDIIVNDTNIFIDMHSVGLLEEMCRLPFIIHTVDFVVSEITDPGQLQAINKLIEDNRIKVHSFSGDEVAEIVIEHANISGNLSIPDVAVCYYARGKSFKLITGDRQLRNYAILNRMEVHGIIFLFDQMVLNRILTPDVGAAKLQELQGINVRLPKSEIESRIERWSK